VPATRSFIAIGAFDEREGQQVPVAFIVAEAAQLGRPLVSVPGCIDGACGDAC
jgi:hypothetical protein